ncbi:MAG: tRNA pseudouridine(38-40) synthase TruA [Saprospiraceae bacterium]
MEPTKYTTLYFLQITYKGTHYQGWQRQKNALGIQQIIEDKLFKVTREKCVLIGCGRTDAGVHASEYFAHLRLKEKPIPNLVYKLNKILPKDIALERMFEMPGHYNAQMDATERTYHYFIHTKPDPFIREISAYYDLKMKNLEGLQQCVAAIKQATDFHAFCKQPEKVPHTKCKIYDCKCIVSKEENKIHFEIRANRFLRGMVRLLVGNLIRVLEGQTSVADFILALKEQKELPFFTQAHPQGLFLAGVKYPYPFPPLEQ